MCRKKNILPAKSNYPIVPHRRNKKQTLIVPLSSNNPTLFCIASINGQTYYQSKREETLFLRHSPTHKRHRSVIIAIATDIEVDIKSLLITCFCIRHILVNHIQAVEPHAMLLASNKLCKSTQPLELSTCLPRRVRSFWHTALHSNKVQHNQNISKYL